MIYLQIRSCSIFNFLFLNILTKYIGYFIYIALPLLSKIKINTVKNGTVKFFNASKGFGFITEEGSDTEHFVHVTGLIDEINEGDAVEFELKEGRKGMNAVNVRVL